MIGKSRSYKHPIRHAYEINGKLQSEKTLHYCPYSVIWKGYRAAAQHDPNLDAYERDVVGTAQFMLI